MKQALKLVAAGLCFSGLMGCSATMGDPAYSDKYFYTQTTSDSSRDSIFSRSQQQYDLSGAYGSNGYSSSGAAMQGSRSHVSQSRPRPYSITPADDQKYQSMNNKLQSRLQKLKSEDSSSGTKPTSSDTEGRAGNQFSAPIPPKATQATPPFPTSQN